jgi:TrmH family RNA methyltransferase
MSRPVFEKVAYREGPDGWLAVADVPQRKLADIVLGERPLVLVIEGVEKPGNIGAMLRTADAAGVDAVIVINASTDLGNPNIVRSSKGTVFCVPVVEAGLGEVVEWLARHGVRLLAATPAADAVYTAVDLAGGVAVAVGAEKPGLSDELMDAAALRVRIPMAGKIDSLNVATSAALLLFEAVRQRA